LKIQKKKKRKEKKRKERKEKEKDIKNLPQNLVEEDQKDCLESVPRDSALSSLTWARIGKGRSTLED
jgi:hypothetical protein